MEVLDTMWFKDGYGYSIGIVKGYDDITSQIHYFIGVAQCESDADEARIIANTGDRFPKTIGDSLFCPRIVK